MNDEAIHKLLIRQFQVSFGAVMYCIEQIARARKTGDASLLDSWISSARQELEKAFDCLPGYSRVEVLRILGELGTHKDSPITAPEKRMVTRGD